MHVTLPADTPHYRELYRRALALCDATDEIESGFRGWRLSRMRLADYGYPISLYANAHLVLATFGMRQYERADGNGNVLVGARPGDVVIDAGGCWGDTALFFADRVGPNGRVLTFEFDPGNLRILKQNLALNPELAGRVRLIERPLWDVADRQLAIEGQGPATRLSFETTAESKSTVLTTTIDRALQEAPGRSVGLIKMDIEGAELPALRGAIDTLRRDRPRLAISVYHSLDDYVRIPRWLAELGLGYRFYLGHQTIFDAETILFAAAD
jgi:FkbM family methyltransferase